jgi:hypothetical protein
LFLSTSPDVTLLYWLRPLLFTLPVFIITILSFVLRRNVDEHIKNGSFGLKESKGNLSFGVAGAAVGSVIGLVLTLFSENAAAVFIGIGLGGLVGIVLETLRLRVRYFDGKGMKKHHIYTFATAAAYLAIYLISRYFFFIGRGYHLYTPDWTAKNILWIACIISCLPGLFGAYRFSFITLAGYLAGVILGEIFGPTIRTVQEGKPAMPYHDGWFYCIATYIVSCVIGITFELYGKGKRSKSD